MEVYLVTNLIDGKQYVGKSEVSMLSRKRVHKCLAKQGANTYFYKAIQKYGWDNFEWKVVSRPRTKEGLNRIERKLIKQYGTKAPNGYNLSDGGEGSVGHRWSKSKRKKHSEKIKSTWTESHRNKMKKIHKSRSKEAQERI